MGGAETAIGRRMNVRVRLLVSVWTYYEGIKMELVKKESRAEEEKN